MIEEICETCRGHGLEVKQILREHGQERCLCDPHKKCDVCGGTGKNTWSNEPPTEPGFYWACRHFHQPEMVKLIRIPYYDHLSWETYKECHLPLICCSTERYPNGDTPWRSYYACYYQYWGPRVHWPPLPSKVEADRPKEEEEKQ